MDGVRGLTRRREDAKEEGNRKGDWGFEIGELEGGNLEEGQMRNAGDGEVGWVGGFVGLAWVGEWG